MHSPSGQQSAHKLAPKKSIQPNFPALAAMPATLDELFRSVALNVTAKLEQPDPTGKGPSRKHDYSLPWAGFTGWGDARDRLIHFEKAFDGKIAWVPFNDSDSNDGPMSLNAFPGRAFVERVTNEGDANLEGKAWVHSGPMPV